MESRGKIFESTLLCLDKTDLTVRMGLKRRSDSETEQKAMKKLRKKEQLGHNFSYPSSAATVGIQSAALRSISLSCRTGNRPQSAPACSFLRYRQYWVQLDRLSGFSQSLVIGT
jgi:hypothetical protein